MSKVHYVQINGRDYDMLGAHKQASAEAWRDLIKFNGMNPFRLEAYFEQTAVEDEAVAMALLAGPEGAEFVEVISSIAFLAMREAGDRSEFEPHGPIMPAEAFARIPLMPTLQSFFKAGVELAREQQRQQPGVDPTRTTRATVSDPAGNRAQRRQAAKKSKT